MRKHQETHNEERKFQCCYCKKMFRTRKVLSVHKSLHTSTFRITHIERKNFNEFFHFRYKRI